MKDIFRLVTSAGQRKIIVLAQWVKDLATIIYISRKKNNTTTELQKRNLRAN